MTNAKVIYKIYYKVFSKLLKRRKEVYKYRGLEISIDFLDHFFEKQKNYSTVEKVLPSSRR